MPPLDTEGLWPPQIEAIRNLEKSLAEDRPRALIQMATGSGKMFTAVNFIYRLFKYTNTRRVLLPQRHARRRWQGSGAPTVALRRGIIA